MKPIAAFVFCVAAVASLNASASIVTGGTRVIFDGSHQAASLSVENSDKDYQSGAILGQSRRR